MNGDIFGNLREWGPIPEQLAELSQAGVLDDHQEGLIRLLRNRHNWRLREMALESIKHLRSPTDKLLVGVLGILMDEGLYYEVRMLAARSLSALLSSRATQDGRKGDAIRSEVIQKMKMLLDSSGPPVLHRVLRECVAAVEYESRAARSEVVLPSWSRAKRGSEHRTTVVDADRECRQRGSGSQEEISWQGR